MAEGSGQILIVPSFGSSLDTGSPGSMPATPTTPSTPSSPSAKPKKANPLNDLIDTEKTYVDNLTGIIRKVAAAWSRSNLPPPELDSMFRSIEGVYKANRSLHSKLKDIGINPSSPKALGDLLMRWIDDLEAPYTAYCTKYCCGFDTWGPVQSNPKLGPVLEGFSATSPPPGNPLWTLDSLFLLPKARLKYYRKLYSRLLKSTAPGRSDHRLLVNALETLDRLLDTLETRSSIRVGGDPVGPEEPEDEVVIDMRAPLTPPGPAPVPLRLNEAASTHGSESSSARGSTTSGGERLSRETASTSISRGSNATLSMPISNLERRLSTQRTLDIFTMKPKVVKLQMTPAGLTFTREIRATSDVTIRFVPRATNQEILHPLGHIYLLSDLFLVCERMSPEDQALPGNEGADMWLCYPPLAGKVLRVSEVPGQDYALQVAIMRKETLILETESAQHRDQLLNQFRECIEFSSSLPPPSKVPPPPVPPLNAIPRFQQPSGGPNEGPSNLPLPDGMGGPPPPEYQPSDRPPRGNPPPNVGPYAELPPHLRPSASAQPLTNPGGNNFIPPVRSTSFTNGPPGPQFGGPPNMHPGQHPNMNPGRPPNMNPGQPPNMHPGQSPNMHPGQPPNMHPGQPLNMQQGPPGMQHGPPNMQHGPPNMQHLPPNMQGGPPHMQNGQPPFPVQPINGRRPGFPPGAGGPFPSGPGFMPPDPGMMPPPVIGLPPRPPSEPLMHEIRKSPSTRSFGSYHSQPEYGTPAPPVPPFHGGYPGNMPRNHSQPSLHAPQPRTLLPSAQPAVRSVSMVEPSFDEPSPPNSPVPEMPQHTGPVTSVISAQMKCKVFLQQQHAQWKSLGSAKLKLYRQDPTNVKQLVVEADNKDKTMLISTIVLTDGVERVGKTGVAIELSNAGARTGVVYMIQLRNETSAGGLFDSLLAGSDRSR